MMGLVFVLQQAKADDGKFIVALIDDKASIKKFCRKASVIVGTPRSSSPEHHPIIVTR
ncbi:hypothetical protein BH24ACI3_BH24ACI3_10110 [soil metagenome]